MFQKESGDISTFVSGTLKRPVAEDFV
jgi:hypothetical protein